MHNQNSICQHFGKCGGCSYQHLEAEEYYSLKANTMRNIARKLGLAEEVIEPIARIPAGSRRRADFQLAVNKGNISLGFCEEKTNQVINLEMCRIVEPEIFAMQQMLGAVLARFKKPSHVESIHITHLQSKFDVRFVCKQALREDDRDLLREFAKQQNLCRLSEMLKQTNEVKILHANGLFETVLRVDDAVVAVELPVAAFLQATAAAQDIITEFVLNHISANSRVVDLYSGCGTFSLPALAKADFVAAYEGSYEMIFALNGAIRKYNLESKISAQSRDLYKNPLPATELKKFDAAIINPPRNGALPQVKEIAKAGVCDVVMVSCNPASFERDAKCLLAAGYNISKIMPIDQFVWSKHMELVASFSK